MEHRQLGRSGLKVPVLCLGTATFGGEGDFFKAWGETKLAEARILVDSCLEVGVNFFDTANVYSAGIAEEILGQVLEGRRQRSLISTKATLPMGTGAHEYGSTRAHVIAACEASLRRLRTDYIDLYYMHAFDGTTPVDETLRALDDLVTSGKVRYTGASNFSGWHLMKSLATSERYGWHRYAAHQAYYSLAGRELEWELIPLCHDQGIATVVWSPLAGGALSGKIRRGSTAPKDSRIAKIDFIPYDKEQVYGITDALLAIGKECERTPAQVALNWLLQRPTVASIVIGARNASQLKENLAATDWQLNRDQLTRLNAASAVKPIYPYWHQRQFSQLLNPPMLD